MKTNVKSYGVRTDKAMRTWMQLVRSFTKVRNKELVYIQENNLTMNQFQVLEVLYHRGNLNVGSITKLIMSTPGNLTVVVKNLKRDELISSIKDPSDKRAYLLSITKKGKDIIEAMFSQHASNLAQNFEVMNDAELDTLFSLLRKLQKAQ